MDPARLLCHNVLSRLSEAKAPKLQNLLSVLSVIDFEDKDAGAEAVTFLEAFHKNFSMYKYFTELYKRDKDAQFTFEELTQFCQLTENFNFDDVQQEC